MEMSDLSALQYFKSAIRSKRKGKYKRKLGFGHNIIDFNVDRYTKLFSLPSSVFTPFRSYRQGCLSYLLDR